MELGFAFLFAILLSLLFLFGLGLYVRWKNKQASLGFLFCAISTALLIYMATENMLTYTWVLAPLGILLGIWVPCKGTSLRLQWSTGRPLT